MTTKELEEKLKLDYDAILTKEFECNNKKYAKATKIFNNNISYVYFEIDNQTIKKVTDFKTLDYFKTRYENRNNDIVY